MCNGAPFFIETMSTAFNQYLDCNISRSELNPLSYLGSSSVSIYTLKCLSIGTPKIINFPFVSNGKLMIFRCPNIQTDYNEAVLCLNFGIPENNEFSIWDKWKIYYL